VSEETAAEMAAGRGGVSARRLAVSTTGIAGPDGGTPEKPVGTVCLGLASGRRRRHPALPALGTRDWVKLLASQLALDWMRGIALGLAGDGLAALPPDAPLTRPRAEADALLRRGRRSREVRAAIARAQAALRAAASGRDVRWTDPPRST
jgi:hypothetical protein